MVEKFDAIRFPVLICDMLSMEDFELLYLVLDQRIFFLRPDVDVLGSSLSSRAADRGPVRRGVVS